MLSHGWLGVPARGKWACLYHLCTSGPCQALPFHPTDTQLLRERTSESARPASESWLCPFVVRPWASHFALLTFQVISVSWVSYDSSHTLRIEPSEQMLYYYQVLLLHSDTDRPQARLRERALHFGDQAPPNHGYIFKPQNVPLTR